MKNMGVMFSKKSDEWTTPLTLFNALHAKLNFTIDLAAKEENKLLPRYLSDSLNASWQGEFGFLNPPYSISKKFVQKAVEEQYGANLIVMLLPCRTETSYFHLLPSCTPILFIKGRLKFGNSINSAPFPSCLVLLGKNAHPAGVKLKELNLGKWSLWNV